MIEMILRIDFETDILTGLEIRLPPLIYSFCVISTWNSRT